MKEKIDLIIYKFNKHKRCHDEDRNFEMKTDGNQVVGVDSKGKVQQRLDNLF